MKATGVIIFLMHFSSVMYAQETVQIGYFKYQLTSENFSAVCDLFCRGTESSFILYDKDIKHTSDTISDSKGGDNRTTIRVDVSDGNDFVLYKNYQTNQMISRELVVSGRKCIVKDSIPQLVWKLTNEKKRIGPYSCQKATTSFRCADYTAWFTTAIPLPYGPWKLGGLPGLIVEVINEKVKLKYTLIAAEYPANKTPAFVVAPPKTNDPVYSFADFATLQQQEIKKVRAFLLSKSGDPFSGQFKMDMPECFTSH